MERPEKLISVVIVNYRVPLYLRQAIRSLLDAALIDQTEIIVVDNASRDNSRELIVSEFPQVQWIDLKNNVGFGKACNVGARAAKGEYLLLLNPDTIISKNTLAEFVGFMKSRPEAGLIGPKILNPDGSLQVSCRRSFPTPMVAFYKLWGLSSLFPKSKTFGRYNLTYLDPDQVSEVDAVSGSCMFLKLSLYREIGGFDERFFMYGEDLDLCAQVKERGLSVWYCPHTQIIHFKGRSSPKRSIRSRSAFYKAMILFSEKYHRTKGAFFPHWFIYLGITLRAVFNISGYLVQSLTACFIDIVVINAVLAAALVSRFSIEHLPAPYQSENVVPMVVVHGLMSAFFLAMLGYRRAYSKDRYSYVNVVTAGGIASVMFVASLFFLKSMAYSRIALAAAAIVATVLLALWREVLPKVITGLRSMLYITGKVIILGSGDIATSLIEKMELDSSAKILGVIWPEPDAAPAQFGGYPVLGTMKETRSILQRCSADLLLVATSEPWYSHIIEALGESHIRNLTIRWVPHDLLKEPKESLPEIIPLHDFSV